MSATAFSSSMSQNPRGDTVVHWIVAFGVIDTLAVMLRFFVRRKSGIKIAADDWMVMASLVPTYFMIGFAYLCVTKGGAGKHEVDVKTLEIALLLKYLIPATFTYSVTITVVKISILLLYRRVFDTVTFKRATLVVGFLCITWLCGNVFAYIFLCSPISAAWDPKLIFSNHCGDFQAYLMGIAISNLLLDLIILCMPLPIIWNLNLSIRKKLEVSGIILLGSFTCGSSLVRILSNSNIKGGDFTYDFLKTYFWSHIETATAIWCACLMTYRPLFTDIDKGLRNIFGSGKRTLFNVKELFSGKTGNNSTGSELDALGRNLRGQESLSSHGQV